MSDSYLANTTMDCDNSDPVLFKFEILNDLSTYFKSSDTDSGALIAKFFNTHNKLFQNTPRECIIVLYDIQLHPDIVPIKQPFYHIGLQKREAMQWEVQYLIIHGLATLCGSPWASPCILVHKPHMVRLSKGQSQIKFVCQSQRPLPRIDGIHVTGNAKFQSQIDFLKGYYQTGLTECTMHISALITPFGLFRYERLRFGLQCTRYIPVGSHLNHPKSWWFWMI